MNSSRSSEHERSPHVADPEVVAAFAALHTDVTHVLRRWIAPDAQQEARRTAYLAHLDEHPDAVAKAGPGAHLTASCLVLDASGEHVLLTHHKRAGQWFQFGGTSSPVTAPCWAPRLVRPGRSPGWTTSHRHRPRSSSTGTSSWVTSGLAASTWTSGMPHWHPGAAHPG